MSTTWLQVVLTTLASNLAQTLPADDNIVSSTESLPTPQPWSDRPLCPLWGPMDGFYREGIEAGRVCLIKETKMIYCSVVSILAGGGYKTASRSSPTCTGGAGARSTATTSSTTLSTGRQTSSQLCEYKLKAPHS